MPFPAANRRSQRTGLTLLEVLVACGILVVGLASLASVLPAAGSRLAQATVEDRAGVAATNAFAEIVNRGLLSNDLFQTKTKSCVFGRVLDQVPSLSQGNNSPFQAADPAVLAARIDSTRGFLLEDELVFGAPTTSETPPNQFFNNNAGPREYREGICWGGLLVPVSGTAAAGADATLSVAVFRKAGASRLVSLQAVNAPLFQYNSGGNGNNSSTGAVDEQLRRQVLAGCSYVLAMPLQNTTAKPTWLKIMSSWTNPGQGTVDTPEEANSRTSFVSLDLDPLGSNPASYFGSGSPLTVVAFENLIRVDQYTVSLE